MKKLLVFALIALCLISCTQPQQQPTPEQKDTAQRSNQTTPASLQQVDCVLNNPDTSVSGIKIRNAESAVTAIGNKEKIDSNDQYHYYSAQKDEILTLTQHPGDINYSMSIFTVAYADKPTHQYKRLAINRFTTEKKVQLGISKEELIKKLGTCYTAQDSTKTSIKLFYKLESPNDSKTRLLAVHNMPMYYASYKLRNNKLEAFEFGFKYP